MPVVIVLDVTILDALIRMRLGPHSLAQIAGDVWITTVNVKL